jgi:hypothetical protein
MVFANKPVRSDVNGKAPVRLTIQNGKDHNGYVPVFRIMLYYVAYLEAAFAWHDRLQQNQIRLIVLQLYQAFFAITCGYYAHVFFAQY